MLGLAHNQRGGKGEKKGARSASGVQYPRDIFLLKTQVFKMIPLGLHIAEATAFPLLPSPSLDTYTICTILNKLSINPDQGPTSVAGKWPFRAIISLMKGKMAKYATGSAREA